MKKNNTSRPDIPELLYEDNHLIAVWKRPSDLTQRDKSGDESLDDQVRKYIAAKYNKPGDVFLGVVHRLDRPVSGVMLYARTSKALARLNAMFRSREVKKVYWALVKERPPEDEQTLTHFIKKNESQNKAYSYDKEVKGSKEASLSYKLLARSDRYYLLEIELHTGRHHQIRSQLSAIRCPVKGDLKYGYPRSNEDGSVCLHARRLIFIHPVQKVEMTITAHLPEGDVWQYFKYMD